MLWCYKREFNDKRFKRILHFELLKPIAFSKSFPLIEFIGFRVNSRSFFDVFSESFHEDRNISVQYFYEKTYFCSSIHASENPFRLTNSLCVCLQMCLRYRLASEMILRNRAISELLLAKSHNFIVL